MLADWLRVYETACEVYGATDDEMARWLYKLLPSNLLILFHHLGPEARGTYDNLKAALKTAAETSPG